ncbi:MULTISPECIES: glycosyltransferase family 4 protein [unclassified Mycolicibacterium]|uniref:glycosyltransferase family 4 protein n=1 Tax=unclassified Mycolicibacterium TaxID=2636767 RepID=UPI001EE42356|nr:MULTISPECIES: glycosyltransferase family 4 protein [unclassified Mycolicibacterium]
MTDGRIVLVEFSPSGGLFQFAAQLGSALANHGESVELWTGPDPEITSAQAGFDIRAMLPTWHPNDTDSSGKIGYLARRGHRAARLVLAWLVLGYRLRQQPPRAVLFSQWRFTFEPWFVVAIAALLPHTTFGIVAHEPLPRSDAKDTSTPKQGRLLNASFAAAWRRMDAAFVLGPQTRRIVLDTWHPRCEVHVIPHGDSGALQPDREPLPVAQTDPVALFFGTWTMYKGIDVLIDAFGLVRSEIPAARLILAGAVGGDIDGERLIARAHSIGAGAIETRPGYVALDDVPALIESARVLVVPYLRASQSGVAHLAYTFGRPVVGTVIGDLPAAIDDGVTGLLVPPGDAQQLADALVQLLSDPQLAARLGAAGKDAVQQSWSVAAATISGALNAAADQHQTPDSRPRSFRSWWWTVLPVLVVIVATAVAAIATHTTNSPQSPAAPTVDLQPFAPNSPFRTAVPADATVDPNSTAMITAVTWNGGANAGLVEFATPIYTADENTPRYDVPCVIQEWGPCPFDGRQVPIPDGARPQSGSDGAMIVIDPKARLSYEFWRADHQNNSWTTQFSGVHSLDGTGWGGAATGSGASLLGGVIRIDEIARGEIPHALAVQSNHVCATVFRPPAVKTDGRSTDHDCLPEGTRLQLDPAIDLDTLKLTPAESIVARALQRYGAYIVDVSGAPLSISFERDNAAAPGTVGEAYRAAGLAWDYDKLSGIPWKSLRVIK